MLLADKPLTRIRMTNITNVAFIGLGVMGGPMAAHLAAAGHRVIAYNRTRSRAEAWLAAQQDKGRTATLLSLIHI